MKKILLVSIVSIMSVSLPLFGQFRNAEWGMSAEEVIELEGKPEYQEEDMLAYVDSISGYSCFIYFRFTNGFLTSANYAVTESYTNRNRYIDQYEMMKSNLSSVYGEPETDTENWSNTLYRDDPSEYGFAVSLGHLRYVSSWTTESTEITNFLSGNNYEIYHFISYTSREYKDMEEKAKNRSNTEGL